jgi:diguanylate cyclase (GGDEF)-like protein/PAS domain S-box-containing protein
MDSQPGNYQYQLYLKLIASAGIGVCLISGFFFPLERLNWELGAITLFALVLGSRISIFIQYTKTSISVADVFTILVFLLYGSEAATILSYIEAYLSSGRYTKNTTLKLFNAGALSLSFFIAFYSAEKLFGHYQHQGKDLITLQGLGLVAASVLIHYFLNSGLMAFVSSYRYQKSFISVWREHYFWLFVPFLASGSAAMVGAGLINQFGFLSVFVILPIVGILYFTYQSHREKLEAVTAQAEQSEKHLVEMRESEERFRSAFSNAPNGIAILSNDGKWLQVNDSLCKIFGYTDGEFEEKSLTDVVYPNDLIEFLTQIGFVIQGKKQSYQDELRYYNSKGEMIWTQTSISLLSQAHNSRLICQIQDITARRKAEEKLRHDAFYDSLTDLANRTHFMGQLNQAILRAREELNYNFATIFVDLDRFKLINDSIGHTVGDKLLVAVAKRLKNCLPENCSLSRFGSDEFLILMDEDIEEEKMAYLVEEIQKQISLVYGINGHEISITASIGIVYFNKQHQTAEDVLRDADTALHIAKTQGRSRYVIFDEEMRVKSINQMQLEKDLHRAVEREELFLVYQPIVALADKKLIGFEALVRWNHPKLGLVAPAEFIPLAEENGIIIEIGKFVLEDACRQLKLWQNAFSSDLPLMMSVNVSTKQLLQKHLFTEVFQVLEKYRIAPSQLKLEITESVVVENFDLVLSVLKQFRAMGVNLSMDDFGTGYSSLSYLHKLPINTLKIDRSFVSQMLEETERAEIVKTIVLLAKNLKLDIIAEGIETPEQHTVLVDLGCEFGQGYLFSKPLNVEAASVFICDSFATFDVSFANTIQNQSSILEH